MTRAPHDPAVLSEVMGRVEKATAIFDGDDWNAREHIRFLRRLGGAGSGYTADLIEKLIDSIDEISRALHSLHGGEKT